VNKFAQDDTKNVIHQGLKGGWGIVEAKGHDQKFNVPMVCSESCFLHILLLHPNLMIPGTEIKF
jgi:hypothetical protein